MPPGLSVYWLYCRIRSSERNTRRALHQRHTSCPSTAPSASVGKRTWSFWYAFTIVPEECTFRKCTGMSR